MMILNIFHQLYLSQKWRNIFQLNRIFYVIKELDILGCNSILIEAGGTLAGSFFDKRLVDKVYAFISPSIFGGKKAPNAIEGEGIDKIKERINLKISSIEQLDEDILIIGRTH